MKNKMLNILMYMRVAMSLDKIHCIDPGDTLIVFYICAVYLK